jgi:hypothetical protein
MSGDAGASPASPPAARTGGPVRSPRVVYVGDVAQVADTHWERRTAYRYLKHGPGKAGEVVPSIEVSVIQNPRCQFRAGRAGRLGLRWCR